MNARTGLLALIALLASCAAHAQPCSHHLLVSWYFSNNVAIYDACSGAFLRQLETAGRISGAQAVRINPADGLVISGELARSLKQNYGALLSGILALTLNAGAYISEVFRAGIQSIDRGQIEAARSLGLSFSRTMLHVVLPQAFRRMLPPLGNNAIALLKDSSLISAIGLAELAYTARTVAGAYSRYWEPYLTISLMYWILTLGLAWAIKRLETRYGRGDTR